MKTITLENPEGLRQLFIKKNWRGDNDHIKVVRDKDETVLVDARNYIETITGNSITVSIGSTFTIPLDDPADEMLLGWKDIPELGLLLSINGRNEFLRVYKSAEQEAILNIGKDFPTLKNIDFGSEKNQTIQTLDCLIGCHDLNTLNINSCSNLKDISALLHFKELKTLWMHDFAEWSQLNHIGKCTELKELRHRRGKLKSLKHLKGLVHLEYCDVSENDFVKLFPVSGLSSLKKLYLSNCKYLIEANAFTEFTSLTHLDLSECKNLNSIESLSGLNYLTYLNLKKTNISSLPVLLDVTSLKHLDSSSCENLVNIASLSSQTSLTYLDLSNCEKLANITALSDLTSLKNLNLKGCRSINDLKAISGLRSLNHLNLESTRTNNLTQLSDLTSLTYLNLSQKYLTDLSGLSNLHSLITLDLTRNTELFDLSPLSGLKSLKILHLKDCEKLRELAPLSDLKTLVILDLSICKKIKDITALSSLTSLEELELNGCDIYDLTPIASLNSLTFLDLSHINNLTDLTPLACLVSLTALGLISCKRLTDLTALANLSSLEFLFLSRCENINDITPLSDLKNLTKLDLSQCSSITDLSSLSRLTSLTSINLFGLVKLTSVKNLSFLPNLQIINLLCCPNIHDIEKLSSLTELRELEWDNSIIGLKFPFYETKMTRKKNNPLQKSNVICHQILMQCTYNRKDPKYVLDHIDIWISDLENCRESTIYISKVLQCISLLDKIDQKAQLLSSIVPMRKRGLDHPDKVNELEAASWTHWCALAIALPIEHALECLYAAVNNLDIFRETEVLLGPMIEAAATLLIEYPNQREHLRTWVEAQLHHLEAYPEQKRQIAPSAAFFYATLHQDDQVRLWLKIATDEKAPHWRDKVLAALVNYHTGRENFEEARQILAEIQIQEIKDGAIKRLAEAMAVKYPIDAGFLLDAIQSLDIRIEAAKKLLNQPAMLAHPQGIYQLFLNLQDDPDALAEYMELLIRQDQEGGTVRMIQMLFQHKPNTSATVFLDLCTHPALTGFVKLNKLEAFKKRLIETHEREKADPIGVFLEKLQQEGLIEEAEVLELSQLMQA